jgi:uncharacterized protein YcfJ
MDAINPTRNIHPLMAGAAVSVILVSLLGAAALAGILPTSHGEVAPAIAPAAATAPAPVAYSAPVAQQTAQYAAPATVVHHKYVVHHTTVARPRADAYAQAAPEQPSAPTPVYQQPAPVAHNSPVGIGVGAVVGGLLGSQVGGGNGRTLATIAGAVGGGYVGNEIAKQNQ